MVTDVFIIPPCVSVGDTEELIVTPSEEMVQKFSVLTGDRSSLHTSSTFSRRSMFRERVVHGMLPVMFIASLKIFESKNISFSLKKIHSRFLKPVFIDESLKLVSNVTSLDKKNGLIEISFKIQKKDSGEDVTVGFMSVLCRMRESVGNNHVCNKDLEIKDSMVEKNLSESNYKIEDITIGEKEKLIFKLKYNHINELKKIVHDEKYYLKKDKLLKQEINGFDCNNLLAVLLLSTFVGMCRPGKLATFIDFSFNFLSQIKISKKYYLEGIVTFVSDSTQILVQEVNIFDSENSSLLYAQGKVKAKVNDSPIKMPHYNEIRDSGLDFQLKNKVVLVTGASRGIGETVAKLFALHGARVAVNYLSGEEDANSVVSEILEGGGIAESYQGDVTDSSQIDRMVKKIEDDLAPISILVNNAVRNAKPFNFLDVSWAEVQKDIDVILMGAFNCCQAVVPGMIAGGGGKIINISSLYAENPPTGQFKYSLTKSALSGFSRSLAVEMAPHNIFVNMVTPSMVDTDLAAGVPKYLQNAIKSETPMKRLATPLDVARAVIFLASSQASFTTGQKIMVTGGLPPYL